MSLFNEVRTIIQRLAPLGWWALLQEHGLDLNASNLEKELSRPLNGIDRMRPGFEDFSSSGRAAITPGKPALSLLYHALESPSVLPKSHGSPTMEDFPTLAELDVIENYTYSLAQRKLSDFNEPFLAVVAYQYRIGSKSPHQRYADMAYSRTGISRVGTASPNYDPIRRSFWIAPENGQPGIAVMPARFAAFIAEFRRPTGADSVLHSMDAEDRQRRFVFPVHKLFPGDECLRGLSLKPFTFREFHINEKLRKIHSASHIPRIDLLDGFDLDQSPFVRTSKELLRLEALGASILVVPLVQPTLVSVARQHRSTTQRVEIVRFLVPKRDNRDDNEVTNRFTRSSMQIEEFSSRPETQSSLQSTFISEPKSLETGSQQSTSMIWTIPISWPRSTMEVTMRPTMSTMRVKEFYRWR